MSHSTYYAEARYDRRPTLECAYCHTAAVWHRFNEIWNHTEEPPMGYNHPVVLHIIEEDPV